MLLRYPVSECCTTPNLCQEVHHHSLTSNPDSSFKLAGAGELRDQVATGVRSGESLRTFALFRFSTIVLRTTLRNKCVVKFSET